MNKISVVIPNFNRTKLIFEAVSHPLIDERVSEIVISDDHSDPAVYMALVNSFEDTAKIKLHRNKENIQCYRNKKQAVSLAINEYVLLLDSDNRIDKQSIDAIYAQPWSKERILQPVFAKPHFDFRKYTSLLAHKSNVAKYANDSTFTTALNACNYFVNRDEYLRVWDGSVDPVTSDSIFMAYNWFKAGNSMYFTPGLEYFHRVNDHGKEEPSHYGKFNNQTPKGFHESVVKKLKALR